MTDRRSSSICHEMLWSVSRAVAEERLLYRTLAEVPRRSTDADFVWIDAYSSHDQATGERTKRTGNTESAGQPVWRREKEPYGDE